MRDWPDQDVLTGAVATSTASTLTVAASSAYFVNQVIEIDQEALIVRLAPSSGTTLTVARGAYGSTAATHANAAPILKSPGWLTLDYLDALNAALFAAWPLVYKPVVDESLSTSSLTYEYAIPNMAGTTIPIPAISEVWVKETGDTKFREKRDWDVVRGATPKIKFKRDEPAGTLRIVGFGPFTRLAYTDSLDVLFPPAAEDPLVEYVASRLLASGEAGRLRVNTGAVDDREQAVRAGSSIQAGSAMLNRFLRSLAGAAMPPMPKHVQSVI